MKHKDLVSRIATLTKELEDLLSEQANEVRLQREELNEAIMESHDVVSGKVIRNKDTFYLKLQGKDEDEKVIFKFNQEAIIDLYSSIDDALGEEPEEEEITDDNIVELVDTREAVTQDDLLKLLGHFFSVNGMDEYVPK